MPTYAHVQAQSHTRESLHVMKGSTSHLMTDLRRSTHQLLVGRCRCTLPGNHLRTRPRSDAIPGVGKRESCERSAGVEGSERERQSPWWSGVFGAGRPACTEPSAVASPLLDAILKTLRGEHTCEWASCPGLSSLHRRRRMQRAIRSSCSRSPPPAPTVQCWSRPHVQQSSLQPVDHASSPRSRAPGSHAAPRAREVSAPPRSQGLFPCRFGDTLSFVPTCTIFSLGWRNIGEKSYFRGGYYWHIFGPPDKKATNVLSRACGAGAGAERNRNLSRGPQPQPPLPAPDTLSPLRRRLCYGRTDARSCSPPPPC